MISLGAAIFDIFFQAISKVLDSPDETESRDSDLEKYAGQYIRPIGCEIQVIIHKGDLALLYLPTDNPLRSLTHVKRVEKNIWRRIRDDGELGEKIEFEVDEEGRVTRMIQFNQYAIRVH